MVPGRYSYGYRYGLDSIINFHQDSLSSVVLYRVLDASKIVVCEKRMAEQRWKEREVVGEGTRFPNLWVERIARHRRSW